jgi:hypothetical protein
MVRIRRDLATAVAAFALTAALIAVRAAYPLS